jgi:hypothetical protein
MIKSHQGNDSLTTAQGFAVDLVKERAMELGRQEWLNDPWGVQGGSDWRAESIR